MARRLLKWAGMPTITISRNGQLLGPFSLDAARMMVLAGKTSATDWAWQEGARDWVPLNQIPGFLDQPVRALSVGARQSKKGRRIRMAALFIIAVAGTASVSVFILKEKRNDTSGIGTVGKSLEAGKAIIEERRKTEAQRGTAETLDRTAELQARKQAAQRAVAELAKFKVKQARFFKKGEHGSLSAMIELSLVNQTSVTVSRAYFAGTLTSPGREVPWAKGVFCKGIPGGMNSGESRELKLMPFETVWDLIDPPSDAVLAVVITRLDGPDGRAIFDIGPEGDLAFDTEVFRRHAAENSNTPEENLARGPR